MRHIEALAGIVETSLRNSGASVPPPLPLMSHPHWDRVPVLLSHTVAYIEAPSVRDTLEFSLWFSLTRCVLTFCILTYINLWFSLTSIALICADRKVALTAPTPTQESA